MTTASEITWKKGYKDFDREGKTPEGTWYLNAPMRGDGIVRFTFALPLPEGETFKSMWDKRRAKPEREVWTAEDHLEHNMLSMGAGPEQGFIASHDDAKRMIDELRSLPKTLYGLEDDGWTLRQTIAARADVPFDLPTEVWKRDSGRGSFTLFVDDRHINLDFSGNSANRWDNLLTISNGTASHDGSYLIPYFWPEPLQSNFRAVAVHLANVMADEFQREGWTKGRRRQYVARPYRSASSFVEAVDA